MKYIVKIKNFNNTIVFYAILDKYRALKVITELWPTFNSKEYKIFITLKGE